MSFKIGDKVINTEKNLEGIITAVPSTGTKVNMYLVKYSSGEFRAVPESKISLVGSIPIPSAPSKPESYAEVKSKPKRNRGKV